MVGRAGRSMAAYYDGSMSGSDLANRLYFARQEYPAHLAQEKEDEVRILSQLR